MNSVPLKPDKRDAQGKILLLMRASSCFASDVCLSPPCACAQSLIDAIAPAWQPIETVPDDGRDVLIWADGRGVVVPAGEYIKRRGLATLWQPVTPPEQP